MSHRWSCVALLLVLAASFSHSANSAAAADRPNIVLIITDDQGYGDLGCHGNPDIHTPHLDAFAKQSVHLKQFYVCPVCAPTRSALLTGRYNYRTGVTDTYLGRALMRPEEVTLAEHLSPAGYATGIFGKWHLGDNAPLRAMDQGFQESLVLKGGGIGQPSDPPGGESYFDPLLLHNGKLEKTSGYCSNVYTDAAMRFIEGKKDQPFFVYLAFNAPHAPLEVPEENLAPYRGKPLTMNATQGKVDPDVTARVYGMVSNIDDNLGRLFAKLDALKLAENTIVIFLTDNGPQQPRYTAGLRGLKGSTYEGGMRVPFYVRWQGHFPVGTIDTVAAHIDVVPTLLAAAGVEATGQAIDGRSLLPLLEGKTPTKETWPERTIFTQWHRGDEPDLYRCFSARSAEWKLVQMQGTRPGPFKDEPRFELFHIASDPFEKQDLSASRPEILQQLQQQYEAWFRDVTAAGFAPPRIHVGDTRENPVLLTRQDWRGPAAGWSPKDVGHWEIEAVAAGHYAVTVHAGPGDRRPVKLEWGGQQITAQLEAGATHATLKVTAPSGPARIQATIGDAAKPEGPKFLEVRLTKD